MKKLVYILIMICLLSNIAISQSVMMHEIKTGWKFRQARLNNWYPATVPGVVHTDLINNNIIEDPYYRLNERGLQWIDKEDWIYETTFDVSAEALHKGNISLLCKGLDTYADVYLNDKKIIIGNNMFRQWEADVKNNLKEKGNVLRVYFYSPIKMDMPKWDSLPYKYEAGNDQSENGGVFDKKVSVFARKAGYHYGWDWGPRFVTSGIWRPIYIKAWDDVVINNTFYRQPTVTEKKAEVINTVELMTDKTLQEVTVQVINTDDNQTLASKKVPLSKGINTIQLPFQINNPKLWWSNGLGDPHLYHFRTEVIVNKTVNDSKADNIGIRSLKVINKPDQYGKSFYVELNGQPVFCKGANYIPCDMFLPRVTPEKYEKTVLDAVNANMNMLRVWGGGIYENDIFYDLCDKYGILLWQDFMFGCSLYPAEGAFLENIRQEAIDNVKRLRNHPSIALWCGNNENNDGWFSWGWKESYEKQNPVYAKKIWKQYVDQYHVVLPEVMKNYDPDAFYWPSSPYSEFGKASNDHSGDRHYWSIWHGKKPISDYNIERSRFFSEYGFQSFPEFVSVKQYAPESRDWDIYSEVMMAHQRGGAHANGLIETYLLNEYQKPKNFPMFLYMNQVLQGDAIKTAMEAHRRDMSYCMGTMYWQHNDVWPVASWSARDYYGRWKAQQYFAREAYKDILVSPILKQEQLHVFIVSDRRTSANGNIKVDVLKLTGEKIGNYEKKVTVNANASNDVFSMNIDQMLQGNNRGDVVVIATYTDASGKIYTNNYFLVKQKDMHYPQVTLTHTIKPVLGGFEVAVKADQFARAVYLSTNTLDDFFENNYFDILPGQTKIIKVSSRLPLSQFEKQLQIISLVDGY